MSVQYGRCNFDGRPVAASEFDRVRPMLERYAPDEEALLCKGSLGILYRAFHTTPESRRKNNHTDRNPDRSSPGMAGSIIARLSARNWESA